LLWIWSAMRGDLACPNDAFPVISCRSSEIAKNPWLRTRGGL
jgi:hypothetical protein